MAQIADAEHRLAAEIAIIREPKAEQLRILYATSTADRMSPLRVDQEMRRVKAAVKSSTRIGHTKDRIIPGSGLWWSLNR